MSSKLFLGNLPSAARERDVEDFFRGFGKIREIVLKTGFGFVEFYENRDAVDALEELNGRNLCGERIRLELSRQGRRDDRRGNYRDDHDRRGNYRDDRARNVRRDKYGVPYKTRYRLTVDNLSTRCSWQDLKDMMRSAGEVTYAEAHKEERNQALVCFASESDLRRAITKFQGKEINGRKIKLTEESSSGGREASRSRSRSPRSRSPRSRSPPRPSHSRSASPARRTRTRSSPRPKPSSSSQARTSRSRSRSPQTRRSESPVAETRRSKSPVAAAASRSRSRSPPPARATSRSPPQNASRTHSVSQEKDDDEE